MQQKQQRYNTGCISSLKSCWAKFFGSGQEAEERETIRLMHPTNQVKPPVVESIQNLEGPLDNAAIGETMWLNYVQDHFDFEQEAEYANYAKSPYLSTCYHYLLLAAMEGCKTSIGYLDKIPGKLRLQLEKQLKADNAFPMQRVGQNNAAL